MTGLELINATDEAVAADIASIAYKRLGLNLAPRHPLTPLEISELGVCFEASDEVTRVAYGLGVFATREVHHSHCITNFSDASVLPNPDDLIMCLTWGQYVDQDQYQAGIKTLGATRPAYFGRREQIKKKLGIGVAEYDVGYSPDTILYRQTTHTPSVGYFQHKWLTTSPSDLAKGSYRVGEVPPSDYPAHMWSLYHTNI